MKVGIGVFAAACVVVCAVVVYSLAVFLDDVDVFGDKVAIVPVKGLITLDACPTSFAGPTCASVPTIKDQLEAADEDSSVKAVVLEINSGGGYPVASRELMRAVQETEKPVVAWIGEAGASGAYYAATGADRILADEGSLTGSIGVIMSLQHYYNLFDWLGINTTTIKSGEFKDSGSPYRPMREEEREMFQSLIDDVHADFIADVAANRNLSLAFVSSIGDGRIYTGSRARQLGLIDGLGGFDDAVELAARMGDVAGHPKLQRFEPQRRLVDLLTQVSAGAGYGFGQAVVAAGDTAPRL